MSNGRDGVDHAITTGCVKTDVLGGSDISALPSSHSMSLGGHLDVPSTGCDHTDQCTRDGEQLTHAHALGHHHAATRS